MSKTNVVFIYYGHTIGNERAFEELARSKTYIHMIDLDHLTIKQREKVLYGLLSQTFDDIDSLYKKGINDDMETMPLSELVELTANNIQLLRSPLVLNSFGEIYAGYYRTRPIETITGCENKIF